MKNFIFLCLSVLMFGVYAQTFAVATSDQYLTAGNTLYNQKDYSKAILYYKAAIQVDPNNAAAHTRLANTYYMLGQKQDALTQYQAALQLNPNNAQLAAFVQKLQAQLDGGSAAPASAAENAPAPKEKGLFIGGALGVDLPQTQGVTTMAVGPELQVGYAFNSHFALRAEIDIFLSSPVSQVNSMDLRVIPEIKYTFGSKGMRPYLLGGVGYDSVSLSSSASGTSESVSASGLDYVIGAGLQFDLGPKLNAYIEAKYHGASLSVGGSSSSGSSSSSSSDSTSVSDIPITAGILLAL